jgi:hypothetical protein
VERVAVGVDAAFSGVGTNIGATSLMCFAASCAVVRVRVIWRDDAEFPWDSTAPALQLTLIAIVGVVWPLLGARWPAASRILAIAFSVSVPFALVFVLVLIATFFLFLFGTPALAGGAEREARHERTR